MELKFGQSCSGEVFIYSQGRRSAVSTQNWTRAEGARLCQDLKCGGFLSSGAVSWEGPFWDASFRCKDVRNPRSIWDCERPRPASQEQQKQLSIQCQGESPHLSLPLGHVTKGSF